MDKMRSNSKTEINMSLIFILPFFSFYKTKESQATIKRVPPKGAILVTLGSPVKPW